ncbi:MAG: arginase family protein, partial [Dehalococcoidia bacterium]|nr:arginase family protein [Dehalococcoidia bacterium]
SAYNHACTLRRILEVAPVTQVGLRSAEAEEAALIRDRGLAYYAPQAYRRLAGGSQEIAERLSEAVYVTIDLDGLDPSQMAAVGTPEPGGLLWDEVVELLAAVARERRIVGFDVTELAPDEGPRACAQLAAKLTYRLIGLALGSPGEV